MLNLILIHWQSKDFCNIKQDDGYKKNKLIFKIINAF